jgi:hypothetical protein
MNPLKALKNANPYGARVRLFRQSSVLRRLPIGHPSRQGVCRAMCLAYSGLIKIGSNIGRASGMGSADREKFETAMAAYTAKLQSEIDIGNATNIFDASIETTRNSAAVVSMKVSDGDCKQLTWNCLDGITTEVTKLPNIGKFFQIFLPNHVICGWTSQAETACLFDPNFGEARVPRQHFRGVLGHVLGHPTVRAHYNLTDGEEIYLVPIY